MKLRLTLDFETTSECDLKKSGAYKYSCHPTTKPTCLSFKQPNMPVQLLTYEEINKSWRDQPPAFRNVWSCHITMGWEFSAHNAFFERCIYTNILVKRYGWPAIPISQWRCTAAKAAACALPRNLEGAGEALNLSTQKDKRGYSVMMLTCKPTKQWNAWFKARMEEAGGKKIGPAKRKLASGPEPLKFITPKTHPEIFKELYAYCETDTVTEELLDKTLPDLSPFEQRIWQLNQEMNWRGVRVDIPLVKKISGMMEITSKLKLQELDKLTMGLVTKAGARQSIIDFCAIDGIELPDIRANTIEDFLNGYKLNGDLRRLLEIRKALSKSSTKKYQSFVNRASEDDRIRDILLYCGASTGRSAGTGLNPYNFPRPAIYIDHERPYAATENIRECDLETLQLLYGEALPIVFSSILRNMIIPSPGHVLHVGDFSKVEVAILWWVSGNKPGLKILNAGKDPYKYQAAANTGKRYQEISDDSDDRQLGKAQVLGCGFRMSWKRFQKAAWDSYRLKLTSRQSFNAVKNYREANKAVCEMWDEVEEAAISAVENRRKLFMAGKCSFYYNGKFLTIELPSRRKLYYFRPDIVWRTITYTSLEKDARGKDIEVEKQSDPKKTLQFYGLDKSKKKLQPETTHGGVLTENIVQATARDLMVNSLLILELNGYRALLEVYDEIICEHPSDNVEEFTRLMKSRPSWADKELPIDVKSWSGPRYGKH